MIRDYMRKDLQNFKPYHAQLKPYDVKMDANENPFPHSETVLKKIEEWIGNKDHLTRYPDSDSHLLREKISKLHKVDKEEVICSVGSDQMIELIIKVFVEDGEVVLVPNPSFAMYTLSTVLNHGKAVAYELDDNFDYNYDKIIEAYNRYKPKLLFICTPNNPTGNKATKEGMIKVLEAVKCPVIIDEAYEEFIDESMISYIKKYPNLVVLRTFSKAYGIAGLRIGYALSNDEMVDMIGIAKPPYNVSSFSQAVAGFILDDIDYYKEHIHKLRQLKNELCESLKSINMVEHVYNSEANFILIKVTDVTLADYLASNKVLVRNYCPTGRLAGHIRVSVGTSDENDQLIKLIKAYKA